MARRIREIGRLAATVVGPKRTRQALLDLPFGNPDGSGPAFRKAGIVDNPLDIDAIDGQLLRLLPLVSSKEVGLTVAVAIRQFIVGHAHKSPGPNSLFLEDWERAWSFFAGDVEPFHDVSWDAPGLTEIQKEGLKDVCVAMLRFLLDRHSARDTQEHRAQLQLALEKYLCRRGHEVMRPPGSETEQSPKRKRRGSKAKKRGPKGPRYNPDKDRGVLDDWNVWVAKGGERSYKTFAKEKYNAKTPKEIREIVRAIEREQKRQRRKGLK